MRSYAEIPIDDAFLRIHETGLAAFDQYLAELEAQATAAEQEIKFISGKKQREFENYVLAHPELAEMRLPDGRNLLHVMEEHDVGFPLPAQALVQLKPSLLEERAGPLELTPTFLFISNSNTPTLLKLLDIYDPDHSVDFAKIDEEIDATFPNKLSGDAFKYFQDRVAEENTRMYQSQRRRDLLDMKDSTGLGLPFYGAAHGGGLTLDQLKNYGIDIFVGFQREGGSRGAAIDRQPNIVGTACAKYRQQVALQPDTSYMPLKNVAGNYVKEFGVDALRDLIRSDIKLYAPIIGASYTMQRRVDGQMSDCTTFQPSEITSLLSTLSPKDASVAAKLVVAATDVQHIPAMQAALEHVIYYLHPQADSWAARHEMPGSGFDLGRR